MTYLLFVRSLPLKTMFRKLEIKNSTFLLVSVSDMKRNETVVIRNETVMIRNETVMKKSLKILANTA